MQAIVGTVQALAEIIVELCREQDEAAIGDGPDIPAIINDYPNPKEVLPETGAPTGPMDKYKACLDDYGLDELETNAFMRNLSQNVSPQQTCDLINGAPSPVVRERIYNIIQDDPYLNTLRASFISVNASGMPYLLYDEIIEFFLCVGGLISPEFCAAVYEPPINSFPDNVDLCDLEDMLVDRLDNDTFNELLDAYNNLDALPEDLALNPPNMNPGCGIVPPLTEMPALHFAIRKLFNTLIEAPKRAFVEDISGLQHIMLVPQPGASARNAELLEELEKLPCGLYEDANPPLPCPPDATGAYPTPGPKPSQPDAFMKDMFGPAASVVGSIPGVSIMQDVVNNAMDYEKAALRSSIHYTVNPVYRQEMTNIDSNLHTNFVPGTPTSGDPVAINRQAYFWIAAGGITLTYGPRSGGAPYESALIVQTPAESLAAQQGSGTPPYQQVNTQDDGELRSIGGTELGAGNQFAQVVFDQFKQLYGAGTLRGDVIDQAVRNALWFPALLSLFNSLAYNVRQSRLFNEDEFRSLILSPRRCQDGSSYGDLSGFDDIMKSALDDFNDNASTVSR